MAKEQKDGLFQLENGNWGYRIKCKINNSTFPPFQKVGMLEKSRLIS